MLPTSIAMRRVMAVLLTLGAGGGWVPCAVAQPQFSITDLGSLGGPSVSYGLNNAGHATGYSYTAVGNFNTWSAYFYDGATMINTGTAPAGNRTFGYRINSSDEIVGYWSNNGAGFHGFRWTPGGGFEDLSAVIGTQVGPAFAVNDAGRIVGKFTVTGNDHAYSWDSVNGLVDLAPTLFQSQAFGVNNAGEVAGVANNNGALHACIWNPTIHFLAEPIVTETSQVLGMNEVGQVVGTVNIPGVPLQVHAMVFTPTVPNGVTGTMTDLHVAGWQSSQAYAVNDAGWVVGQAFDAGGISQAMLWINGVAYNLSNLLDASGAGWHLSEAKAINSHGQILCTGNHAPTSGRAVLLTVALPPCPADVGIQGGLPGHDGALDNNDFIAFINFFFVSDATADVGQQGGVPGADGLFDNNDFIVFINQFFAGC